MGNQRLVGIVGVVVVAAVAIAIAVASGGDDDNATTSASTAATTTETTGGTDTGVTETTTETEPAEPETPVVEIKGGKPVGGVQRLEFKKDDTILFEVSSEDTSGEIHFHGYDIMKDLEAGKSVTFKTKADAEGIFEVEIEDTRTQIAQVRVEP